MPLVGKAHDRLVIVEESCQRLCPPYDSESRYSVKSFCSSVPNRAAP